MTPELFEAIGRYIVFPICFFGTITYLIYVCSKDEK